MASTRPCLHALFVTRRYAEGFACHGPPDSRYRSVCWFSSAFGSFCCTPAAFLRSAAPPHLPAVAFYHATRRDSPLPGLPLRSCCLRSYLHLPFGGYHWFAYPAPGCRYRAPVLLRSLPHRALNTCHGNHTTAFLRSSSVQFFAADTAASATGSVDCCTRLRVALYHHHCCHMRTHYRMVTFPTYTYTPTHRV